MNILNYKQFENMNNLIHSVYDDYYMKGGCYEFAEALGKFFEEKGLYPTYYSYGSKEEPNVHIAVGVNGKFYDIRGEYNTLEDLSESGDFYTDTKCYWSEINAKELPNYGRRDKEIEKIKNDLNSNYIAENYSYDNFLENLGFNYDDLLNIITDNGDLSFVEPNELLDYKLNYLIDLYKNPNKYTTLYRIVYTKNIDDIDKDNLGLSYVSDLESFHDDMINYLYQNARRKNKKLKQDDVFLITIKTKNKNIDFIETLKTFSLHPNEDEITLIPNHNSKIIDIENFYE